MKVVRFVALRTGRLYQPRTELQFRPDPARNMSAKLCDIYHCCVYSEKLL